MPYRLEYTPAALRDLHKLDLYIRKKVVAAIEKLAGDPRPLGVEMLHSKDKLYRVHLGPGKDYRAVYQILDEILLVLVVRVGDRKSVYRHLQ